MEATTIKIALAIIFILSVMGKLTGKTKSTFENAGYNPMIMGATTIAEILFTVGLFTKYELFSTIGLLAIIVGAVLTLFRQKVKPVKYALALITAALLVVLLILQTAAL
jgi:nicotinamide riboside transporter PnuC